MKKQKGAALIVVLSLLVVALMVGLSSMQSSHIDERLAGNYRAQSQAQMGAEQAATEGWQVLLNSTNVIDAIFEPIAISMLEMEDVSWEWIKEGGESGGCREPVSCYYRYIKDAGGKSYIVSMGGGGDDVISLSEPVFVEVFLPPDLEGLIPGVDAALTCVGSECGFFARNPPTVVDGRDYYASVRTTGSISSSDIVPGSSPVAAYVVPEGRVDLGNASVTGEEVFSKGGYDSLSGRISETWDGENGAEQRVKSEIDDLVELGKTGDERVTYWGPGSEGDFIMPSSGIVVVDGTNLIMDVPGNFKFTGLIVVRDGDFNLRPASGAGTVSVVGAIIAQDASVDMQRGNPSLLYSSEALCQVRAIACENSEGADQNGEGGDALRIEEWT